MVFDLKILSDPESITSSIQLVMDHCQILFESEYFSLIEIYVVVL